MRGRERVEAPIRENVAGVEVRANVLGRTRDVALRGGIKCNLLEVDPGRGCSERVV